MTAGFEVSSFYVISVSAMFILLAAAAVSDVRTRHIPVYCSFTLLLLSFVFLIHEGQYFLVSYYLLAVFSSGSRKLKMFLFIGAVIVFANTGNSAGPLIFGLAAVDFLFALRIIGGGDAKILFSMLAFGYRSWIMEISISAVTLIAGFVQIFRFYGFRYFFSRINSAIGHLKSCTVESDQERIRIPFAALLPVSFLLYLFVSFSKL